MTRMCPPNTTPYVIRRNDSLYNIARRLNVPVHAILSANPGIALNTILNVGDILCIPSGRQPYPAPACPGGRQYRVKPGDSLYSIASYYGVTLDDLLRANPGLDPRRMNIGQVICVPVAAPPVARCPENSAEYIIKPGDTIANLAYVYNTDVNDILRLNPTVDFRMLKIGQRICLPRPNQGAAPYLRPGIGPGQGEGPGQGPGPGMGPTPGTMPGGTPGSMPPR